MSNTVIDWTGCFPSIEESHKSEVTIQPSMSLVEKLTFGLSSSALLAHSLLNGEIAHASAIDVIPSAFEPVKVLVLSLAEPLCWIMFAWGCIEVICKRPSSGLDRMKFAAIGFIGIQLIPVLMDVIKSAAPA